jgi:alkylation response protein AidB-like acyl-CoA dehydrogenase
MSSAARRIYSGTSTGRNADEWADWLGRKVLVRDLRVTPGRYNDTMDIFEGTEQIQQLVIARAISGLRIE